MKKILTFSKTPFFILTLIILLGIVLRVLEIDKTSFWFDESFTGNTVKLGWSEMFSVIAADKVHPPLFYIFVKLWGYIFGYSQVAIRAFSTFVGVLAIPLAYFFTKFLLDRKRDEWYMYVLPIVVAISPFFVTYSVEARAYSLIALLSVCLVFTTLKCLNAFSIKYLVLSVLIACILVCTHYLQVIFLIAILFGILVYQFIQRKERTDYVWLGVMFTGIIVVTSIVYVTSLKSVLEAVGVKSMWWIPEVSAVEALRVYYSYMLGVVRNIAGVPPVREFIFGSYTALVSIVLALIHVGTYLYIQLSGKLDRELRRKISFLFSVSVIMFFGYFIMGKLGFHSYVERYTIAGGIILLISFWTNIIVLLKNYTYLPVIFYIVLICLLKPLPPILDYRPLAQALNSKENVERIIYEHPADMVNSMYYTGRDKTFYTYHPYDNYSSWALVYPSRAVQISSITKNDIVVVLDYNVEKYKSDGFKLVEIVGGYFYLMVKE